MTINTIEIKDELVINGDNIHSVETCINMNPVNDIYIVYNKMSNNIVITERHRLTDAIDGVYSGGNHIYTIHNPNDVHEIIKAVDAVKEFISVNTDGLTDPTGLIIGEIMKLIKNYVSSKITVRHMEPSKERQRDLDELKKIRDRYCRPGDYKPDWVPIQPKDCYLGMVRQIDTQSRGSNTDEDKTATSDIGSS